MRQILSLLLTLLVLSGATAMPVLAEQNPPAAQTINQPLKPGIMSAKMAHERAMDDKLVLIDIRSPDEWKRTGLADVAHPITMHQSGKTFFSALEALTNNDKSKPIAIICATGGRTAFLKPHLQKAGYNYVYDVSEGMMGNKKGVGWLKAGLPMKKWEKK